MKMKLFEISFALIGCLASLVAADFEFDEHFKTFRFASGAENLNKPWFTSNYAPSSPYESESHLVPRFAGAAVPFDSLKHGTNPVPSVVKKIPVEDKAYKKVNSPYYTLSDTDDPKIKEFLLKSGAPYCQEIITKDTKADQGKTDQRQMTCYRCKDPKSKMTFEQCSYTYQPQLNLRESRSNEALEKSIDSLTSASHNRGSRKASKDKLPEPYGISEDYFHPEATREIPAEFDERNVDNCERMVKDSMVCMICKDPNTNGKYEQCSYIAQPNEKAYAYTKSSSFGGVKAKPSDQALKEVINRRIPSKKAIKHGKDDEREAVVDHMHYRHEPEELSDESSSDDEEDKEGHGTHYVPDHTYHYPSYKSYKGHYGSYETEEEEEKEPSPSHQVKSKAKCKTVEKDGQSCTICTDPKTGAKSEKCNYSHEPKDKFFKYTKSRSFGYPSEKSKYSKTYQQVDDDEDDESEKAAEPSEKQEQESSAEDYSGYSSEPSTLDYIRSESEKIAKKVKGQGNCREVKKDSMLCTICKDPKTGGDFEQCSYAYEPEDKVYAYSKSKSFGSPTKSSTEDHSGSDEERPEESFTSPVIYPTATSTSVLDYIPKSSESQLSSVYTTRKPQGEGKTGSKVDHGFYDATIRRAEIEKIVKDIGAEDRSKCQKMYKSGMTCYKCTDDKGVTNEECVFVTNPEATEAASAIELVTARPSTTSTTATTSAATGKRNTRQTKDEKVEADKDEVLEPLDEELHEVEPYEYVAETRPVYDKVLGITLPAFMLEKSSHEIEFDEVVEKAKF